MNNHSRLMCMSLPYREPAKQERGEPMEVPPILLHLNASKTCTLADISTYPFTYCKCGWCEVKK